MNSKSLEKIQTATPFLKWFRSYFPSSIQNRIRPYLDQPYQLALRLMDCCDGSEYRSLGDLAVAAEMNKNTACQVLSALREGGLVVMISTTGGWRPLEANRTTTLQDVALAEEATDHRFSC